MTFKDFIKLFNQKYYLFVISVILVLVGVSYFNLKQTKSYEGNIGFSIIRFGQTQKSEFSDFYATEADNLVTANFTKWLKSKPFVAAVFSRANKLSNLNLDLAVRNFDAQKTSGADIAFSYQATGKDSAQKIGEAVISEVQNRNNEIKKASNKDTNLRGLAVTSKLTVVQKQTNILLNYIIGLAGGIILGIILILVSPYFATSIKR